MKNTIHVGKLIASAVAVAFTLVLNAAEVALKSDLAPGFDWAQGESYVGGNVPGTGDTIVVPSGMTAMLLCSANPSAFASSLESVDSFDLSGATCGLGMRPKSNVTVDGNPLTVGGKVYERGIGTRPEGAILFRSNGKVSSFDAFVAIDGSAKDAGSGKSYGKSTARFRVWADSKVVFDSGDIKLGQEPVAVHVELSGAREIALETTGGGSWTAFAAPFAASRL